MREAYSPAQQAAITEQITGIFAGVLDIPAAEVEMGKSFLEIGINSLLSVEVIEYINQKLGIALGFEVIFDTRGIRDLVEYIINQYQPEELALDSSSHSLNV